MQTATVSSKGWVVIPADLRRKYDIQQGQKLQIVDYGGLLSLIPIPEDPIRQARGALEGSSSLLEALRQEREEERAREGLSPSRSSPPRRS